MRKLFASTSLLVVSAGLYAAGFLAQTASDESAVAPTSLSIIVLDTLASGPTLPPDEPTDDGSTWVASGPTLPPDEPTDDGSTWIASGPTLPPDEPTDDGSTWVVSGTAPLSAEGGSRLV